MMDIDFCGGTPWGPWTDGHFTLCFTDAVIYVAHALFLLVAGFFRIRTIITAREVEPESSRHLYKTKLAANIICALIPLLTLGIELALGELRLFSIFSAFFVSCAWFMATAIVALERERGLTHGWALRVWYLAGYVIGSARIQTLLDLADWNKDYVWQLVIFIVNYVFIVFLAVVGLYMNKQKTSSDYESLKTLSDSSVSEISSSLAKRRDNPEEHANIISRATFWWLNPLISLGHSRPLQDEDLFELRESETAHYNAVRFENIWKDELTKQKPSLAKAIWKAYGLQFSSAAIFKIVTDALQFAGPIVLGLVVEFVQDPSAPVWHGIMYAVIMLVSSLSQTLALHAYFHIVFRCGLRIRSALVTAIYKKAFSLSSKARQGSTVGEIVNHMSIDAQRVMDLTPYLHIAWSGPEQILICIVMLWRVVGVSAFSGLGFMILLIPLNIWNARMLGGYQKEMLKHKDKRTKTVNETLTGMRVIKFFAWENSFIAKILGIRTTELGTLRRSGYMRAGTMFLWSSTPLLVALITFTMYALLGNDLTAEKIFTALALFNILRFPLAMFPQVISGIVEARVSIGRMEKFFMAAELDPTAVERHSVNSPTAIKVEGGDFSWSDDSGNLTLSEINMNIPRGSLVAVVGQVGSGKTTLIEALLGNIPKKSGSVHVNGSVAYCSQQAWMQNASLRDNILFSQQFDQTKYDFALSTCQLIPDIRILPAGDETEIGEKGINLSGGQKQRVSLARAVYQNADVYLLDDPLSAVDAHVGRAIYNECIKGALANTTRILVTHQLQYLETVDFIYVLNGGKIVEQGSYNDLIQQGGTFSQLVATHVKNQQQESQENKAEDEAKKGEQKKEGDKKEGKTGPKKLIAAEERDVGEVKSKIYWDYLSSIRSPFLIVLTLITFICTSLTDVGSNWWLSFWTDDYTTEIVNGTSVLHYGHSRSYYLSVYAAWGFGNCLSVLIRSFLIVFISIRAAEFLHNRMLSKVMRAPMSFFDTTPVGRILNRFSKDQYSVDEALPRTLTSFMAMVFSSLGTVLVISFVTPFFLIALLPLSWFYKYIQEYYISSTREIQRLDSISKSPIFAHFQETLSGSSTIRAYHQEEHFIRENERKLDTNQRAYFTNISANRWLGTRLEFLGTSVVSFATLFAVIERGNIDPGLAGLSIIYALTFTSTLNWMVRMSTDVETQLVAVERVIQYTSITTERPPIIADSRPPANWPPAGAIEMKNVELRYREGLELVLRGVSCSIKPMEKIAVVGRTGAGKSSLMLVLFRLVELAGGQVLVDGIDIAKMGLDDLRSRLAIIPQDPLLFEGTIRSNLDPFSQYGDHEMWDALQSVHLRRFIESTDAKLDYPVSENGENLSVGQRQLLCLGRALLRKTKILVMDEATAAVDFETDALIQKTIREEFKDRTVLTIAHRINTIIDYDRIMVLDQGRIVEFDSPQKLLEQRSIFASMVRSSAGH